MHHKKTQTLKIVLKGPMTVHRPQTICVYYEKTPDNSSCVYYGEIKREVKRILIYDCRCNERLKLKAEGSTRHGYTGLCEGLEHLKIETTLRGERFESVKGECVI